ncbi:MAG: DUF2384 domain-containing protein [Xanthomonadaceae bacterium]|nr:DUF2384 domain-containing protein [Xanthomonadaceae bacterium]
MAGATTKPRKLKTPASVDYSVKNAVAAVPKRKKSASGAVSALAQKPASRVAETRRTYRVAPAKTPEATVFDRMGRLLDQSLRCESDVVRAVDAGLPAAAFAQLTRSLDIDHGLIAPESTLRRRVQDNMRFTTDESERMVRIARVHALAVDLFGDEAAAQAWLNAPGAYVPGAAAVAPYKLSVTDAGARLVEELLLRTAHGMF